MKIKDVRSLSLKMNRILTSVSDAGKVLNDPSDNNDKIQIKYWKKNYLKAAENDQKETEVSWEVIL